MVSRCPHPLDLDKEALGEGLEPVLTDAGSWDKAMARKSFV